MGKVFPKTEPGPVRLISADESADGTSQWLVTRYDDAVATLSDQRLTPRGRSYPTDCAAAQLLVRQQDPVSTKLAADWVSQSMIAKDPPDHTRLRKLVVHDFNAASAEAFRPRIQRIADDLLDALAGREQVDLVRSFAFPLFVRMFCELLNVPEQISKILLPPESDTSSSKIPAEAAHAAVVELIETRRAEPTDDLMSRLIAAHQRAELSYDELVAMPVMLLFAGLSTVQLIGNAVMTLLEHPAQRDELLRDPSLVPAAVDEVLRYLSPTVLLSRYAVADVEIGGALIPEGSHVRIIVGSAGHDPAKFADPDTFDIHRGDGDALAFGHGIHYCLGAHLAKIEGQVAITTLLHRFPDLTLTEPITMSEVDDGIMGLERLPVRLWKFSDRAAHRPDTI